MKFDHSPEDRYFFEAEINVTEKEKIKETEVFIKDFLKELLNKDDVVDAPEILMMLLEKN